MVATKKKISVKPYSKHSKNKVVVFTHQPTKSQSINSIFGNSTTFLKKTIFEVTFLFDSQNHIQI